jgi:predicted metal-dependent peptidase
MNYEKSLQNVIFDLICKEEYIFYSLFIAELNKSFTDDPSHTACVAKHKASNNMELIFGKKFWDEYCPRPSQKRALLIHELLHIIHEHLSAFTDGVYPDKKVANLAMDIFINQQIKEEFPTDPKTGKTEGVFLDTFPELALEANKPTIYYYTKIKSAKDKKEGTKGKQDSLGGQAGNKNGSSGSENLDKILDQDEDIHKGWDSFMEGMHDMEKQLLKNEIQAMIKRVAEETIKSRGTLPVNIQGLLSSLKDLDKPVVNWKVLFDRFIGSTTAVEQYQTRKRPNLRFEESPSLKNKYKVKGIVACDSSGSMSNHDIDQINSQLHHIWKAGAVVDFTSWDGDCEPHKKYNGKLTFKRTKAGGTRLGCAIDYINDNYRRNNWNFAVIGTDGYVENDIPKCKIPLLIVITQSGTTELNTKHKIIKIC